MGVTGLWTVVAPTARPTKLETLHRKRLAVDASIWIYQFLKAVRDKEGNALRNSHVVGFFRRICKLLYFGIKPVFVFDGGAPVLKRETIRKRANRREGRRDDAARTAGKLLAVQVARAAEDEAKRQREARDRQDEEELPEDKDLVYVDEIGMDQQQRQAGRTFKRQDQYHLPELNVDLAEMGAPNDPRVMSQAELEDYAKQFHNGEDISIYDFSKIDFDSPFFVSLPAGDKYNILNAARLRSRLRMGYSKEQLDGMFPDRMAFSKFQIERVSERNELTQRLMHVSGMNEGDWDMGGRIAGERGKEYVLVRNEGAEGGWALGVVSNKKGSKKDDAINLDEDEAAYEDASSEEDEDFEDVAIEGVNRIPQSWKRKRQQMKEADYDISYEEAAERIAKKRKAVYDSRKAAADARPTQGTPARGLPEIASTAQPQPNEAADALFVEQDENPASDEEDVFEDVTMTAGPDEGDDDLQRAIAMSLEKDEAEGGFMVEDTSEGRNEAIGDEFDLQTALAESRASRYQSKTNVRNKSPPREKAKFGGPLPFESLNLGQSLLGKKKAKKTEEGLSGGFDREAGDDAFRKARKPQPMPDWFNNAPDKEPENAATMDQSNDVDGGLTFESEDVETRDILHLRPEKEVIDLEAEEGPEAVPPESTEVLEAESEDWNMSDEDEELKRQEEEEAKKILETEEVAQARKKALDEEREKRYAMARDIAAENEEPTMDRVAEEAQAKPPPPSNKPSHVPQQREDAPAPDLSDEEIAWSDSDHEAATKPSAAALPHTEEPAGGRMPDEQAEARSDEEDDLFEDVETEHPPIPMIRRPTPPSLTKEPSMIDQSMFIDDDEAEIEQREPNDRVIHDAEAPPQEDYLEDDSDEELMRQLANEAEEHLRFTNELNHNARPPSPNQAMRDYESELKQLRNQQKKDRRDADEVTQTMIQECQALLRLFGLPYITAPMEAEAQCAELVHLGLVDGIVTDDSDIFLFGGTRIYKNMFNAAKFVECYLSTDLEKEYALDRRKLIRFAHLLGSDYTEGIPGIGPVTALEIISDFPDLSDFKDWTLKVQLGVQTPSVMDGLLTTAFRRKFKRTVQRKLFLPTNFPDLRVDAAYLDPEVDSNNEDFQWGVPDLDKLRSFLMATIGWSQDRTDEILVPVIRDMNKRDVEGVQSNITRFFSGGVGVGAVTGRGIGGYNGPIGGAAATGVEGTAPRNRTGKESGRMKNAYTRLRGEAEKKKRAAFVDNDDGEEAHEEDNNHGTANATTMNGNGAESDFNDEDDAEAEDEQEEELPVSTQKSRKSKSKKTSADMLKGSKPKRPWKARAKI